MDEDSRAEGLSSTNDDNLNSISARRNIGTNVETPLAWDRPFDIKGNVTFTYDRANPLWDIGVLNDFQFYLSAIWRSGTRYTPMEYIDDERNPVTGVKDWRPIYETVEDPAARYSKVGPAWFMMDFNVRKWFEFGGTKLEAFLEITNLLNNRSSVIINPVTGEGYKQYPTDPAALVALRDDRSYDVPNSVRDPRYIDPTDNNLPTYDNPANFIEQRHIMVGLSVRF